MSYYYTVLSLSVSSPGVVPPGGPLPYGLHGSGGHHGAHLPHPHPAAATSGVHPPTTEDLLGALQTAAPAGRLPKEDLLWKGKENSLCLNPMKNNSRFTPSMWRSLLLLLKCGWVGEGFYQGGRQRQGQDRWYESREERGWDTERT